MIVPIKTYCIMSNANEYSKINSFKKAKGYYPKYIVFKNGKRFVDVDKREQMKTLGNRVQTYATSKLYYLFMSMGFDDKDLISFMAKKSKYFNSESSWYVFFRTNLFSVSSKDMFVIEPTMMTEFVRIGTRYIYDEKKAGRLDIEKMNKFYGE